MRFYNGVRASNRRSNQADKLVRSYLSKIRSIRNNAQNYGGSTGGNSSINSNKGLGVIKQRSSSIGDLRRIFEAEGSGRFGARKEAWIAKQYDPDVRMAMEDRQFGRDDD